MLCLSYHFIISQYWELEICVDMLIASDAIKPAAMQRSARKFTMKKVHRAASGPRFLGFW